MLGLSIGMWMRVLAVGAVLAALSWSHLTAYRAGRAAEQAAFIERINQENEDAGEAAEEWRDRLRECIADGRVFDFATGTCEP